eukprot:4914255-Pleurochrysis_carterae.AAC.1
MAGEHQRSGEGYRCKSVEFGFSGMPGGSEVQWRAQRQNCALRLRSMLDVEGKCFTMNSSCPGCQKLGIWCTN